MQDLGTELVDMRTGAVVLQLQTTLSAPSTVFIAGVGGRRDRDQVWYRYTLLWNRCALLAIVTWPPPTLRTHERRKGSGILYLLECVNTWRRSGWGVCCAAMARGVSFLHWSTR